MSKPAANNINFIIDPNSISTRDPLMLEIIRGATKSGVHRDIKKHNNKNECRKWKHKKELE